MNLLEKLKVILTFLLEWLGLAWWVEIVTANPCCTYYFGPFVSGREARFYQDGYIEDLEQENAEIVTVEIMQGQPKDLTIDGEESSEIFDRSGTAASAYFTQVQSR
ncbi:MAG: DUF1816 domain-containing protein [Coleofasciculus sp. Co-bin14]|nr:DUF1816 domain-containing protein [Coleofasciculus sp. Co-bin14]